MPGENVPTRAEAVSYLRDRRNWGRWGADDERGAINLITAEKRVRAASLVRSGRSVSLSRDVPTVPGRTNPMPATHWLRVMDNAVVDHIGIAYHATSRRTSMRCATSGTMRACGTAAIRRSR